MDVAVRIIAAGRPVHRPQHLKASGSHETPNQLGGKSEEDDVDGFRLWEEATRSRAPGLDTDSADVSPVTNGTLAAK